MEKYIKSLLEDIRDAKQNAPKPIEFSENYEEFEEQMLNAENESMIPKSYEKIFGIDQIQLPPSEKLTEIQMSGISDALIDMFESYSVCISLPSSVPVNLKYELIRELFNEPQYLMPGFTTTHDFCDGNCPDCRIKNYCKSCLDD